MFAEKIPCLICVSETDLNYLFEFSLKTCLKNVDFLSEIFVVTPNTELAKIVISKNTPPPCQMPIHVLSDDTCLSKKENEMCGWSKQQLLKLRCNEITKSENILSVGADTVIIKNLLLQSFYSTKKIIVNFRTHGAEKKHFDFEINRVKNIYTLLGIKPSNAPDENFKDYIFDVFLFNTQLLLELKKYLSKKFGTDYFFKLFPFQIKSYADMNQIGEWSLYTIFAIEILKYPFVFQDGTNFLYQVHTQRELSSYNFKNDTVHFVRKDFDKNYIFTQLIKHNIL